MCPGNGTLKSSTHPHHLCEKRLPVPGPPHTDNIFLKSNQNFLSPLHFSLPLSASGKSLSVFPGVPCQGAENRSVSSLVLLKLTKAPLKHGIFQIPDCTDTLSWAHSLISKPCLYWAVQNWTQINGTPKGSHGLHVEKMLQ